MLNRPAPSQTPAGEAPTGQAPAGEPRAEGFAAILRARTSALHREAERSGFIADLIRGRARRGGYALYARNLLPVYEALEAELARTNDVPAAFSDPRLWRAAALRDDLRVLTAQEPAGAADPAVLPEARAYARDVRAAAGSARLAGHAYARYLGDLSGGQILKPMLARTLGLPAEALSVYDFADLPAPAVHKATLRAALDDLDAPAADLVVRGAMDSFRHSIALSLAVQAAAAAR